MPADSNGLALSRSPAEILALVFLGSPDTPGGFFPNGLNGVVGSESHSSTVAWTVCHIRLNTTLFDIYDKHICCIIRAGSK